ncbi:MAG: LON peptidase substrate-binding domain-containing protein, partial [Bacteroidales bacterium]|nr:LON peptidase substrate-binding domain-containing protein [Bacteroidales bacterium]
MNNFPENDLLNLSEIIETEAEFIPLLSSEDEELINAEDIPESLPVLPLRNTVLFPGVVIPITVGRDKSIKLIKESYRTDKIIGVVAQKDVKVENPEFKDMNKIGTVAQILKILQMPDGSTTAIIQGKKRFQLIELIQSDPYFRAKVSQFEKVQNFEGDEKFAALIASLKDVSIQIIKKSPNIPTEAGFAINNIESPVFLVNFVSSSLNIDVVEKQKLLEISDLHERANKVLAALIKDLQMLELKNQIQDKVKTDLDK